MSDVKPDPTVQEPVLTPPQTPDPNPPIVEVETEGAAEGLQPPSQPHPLSPGGVRFEQIYARAKTAEAELILEKEARIRAEAERDLLKQGTVPTTTHTQTAREYTNAELEAMVIEGRATRDQVDDYKEQRMEKRLAAKLQAQQEQSTREHSRLQTINSELGEYLNTIPNLADQNSNERKMVRDEYSWLLSIHGADDTKLTPTEKQSLILNATRNVFGPVRTLKDRMKSPVAEVHQGNFGGNPPMRRENPDQAILDKLTPAQVTHYQKQMRAGVYKNWKEVRFKAF